MRFGMKFRAYDNVCQKIHVTFPIPVAWPEQKVKILSTDVSPGSRYDLRTIPYSGAQMVLDTPSIPLQGELQAIVTVQIEKSFIKAPADTSTLVVPKKKGKELRPFMGESPFIAVDDRMIKKAVSEVKKRSRKRLGSWWKVFTIGYARTFNTSLTRRFVQPKML